METTRSRISKLLLAVAAAATTPGLLLAQDDGAGPGRTIDRSCSPG